MLHFVRKTASSEHDAKLSHRAGFANSGLADELWGRHLSTKPTPLVAMPSAVREASNRRLDDLSEFCRGAHRSCRAGLREGERTVLTSNQSDRNHPASEVLVFGDLKLVTIDGDHDLEVLADHVLSVTWRDGLFRIDSFAALCDEPGWTCNQDVDQR